MAGWSGDDMLRSAGVGAVVALVSTSVAMALLPLAEWLTRITTDLRLLELADPARPLLKRLATEAPGTWAHSLQMAKLCEAACDAIGANGLLARVGCYYHDVGKLVSPEYFVENQQGGATRTTRCLRANRPEIIRQHVTHGLELADAGSASRTRYGSSSPSTTEPADSSTSFEQASGPGAVAPADEPDFGIPGPGPEYPRDRGRDAGRQRGGVGPGAGRRRRPSVRGSGGPPGREEDRLRAVARCTADPARI